MLDAILAIIALASTAGLVYVLKFKKVQLGFTAFNEFVDVVGAVKRALDDKQIKKAELQEILKEVDEFIEAVRNACE